MVGIGDALFPDDGSVAINDTGAGAGGAEIETEMINGEVSLLRFEGLRDYLLGWVC